jgi:hypothetical protein
MLHTGEIWQHLTQIPNWFYAFVLGIVIGLSLRPRKKPKDDIATLVRKIKSEWQNE